MVLSQVTGNRPMCVIPINWYEWDWSESEGKRPKPTPLPHMRLWSPIVSFYL